jgi:CRAL/TRIO domain
MDQVRAHFIAIELMMESQEDQILGVVHVGDFAGANTSHVSLWKNPVEMLRILKWGEQSVPMRHKEVHVYNVPTLLKYVVDAGKSIVSSKMKDRCKVSLNFCSLHIISSTDLNPDDRFT